MSSEGHETCHLRNGLQGGQSTTDPAETTCLSPQPLECSEAETPAVGGPGHGVPRPEKDLSRPPDPLRGPQSWNPAQPGPGLGQSEFGGSPVGVPWRPSLQGGKVLQRLQDTIWMRRKSGELRGGQTSWGQALRRLWSSEMTPPGRGWLRWWAQQGSCRHAHWIDRARVWSPEPSLAPVCTHQSSPSGSQDPTEPAGVEGGAPRSTALGTRPPRWLQPRTFSKKKGPQGTKLLGPTPQALVETPQLAEA